MAVYGNRSDRYRTVRGISIYCIYRELRTVTLVYSGVFNGDASGRDLGLLEQLEAKQHRSRCIRTGAGSHHVFPYAMVPTEAVGYSAVCFFTE